MTVAASELSQKHCQPCEGGVPALSAEEVREHLRAVPHGGSATTANASAASGASRISRPLLTSSRVGEVAESEDHHPDLHLTGYRNVAIELSTHAVGGLTENDFILAAKIDPLPVELKK